MANAFNDFFVDIRKNIQPIKLPPLEYNVDHVFDKFKLLSVVDVREVVEGLRDRVATSDGIPTKLIKQLFSVNPQVNVELVNQTLNSGKVPQDIKTCNC